MTLQELFDQIDAKAMMAKSLARDDYRYAQEDCKQGFYDKWYRYNRKDDGLAYDLGWQHANETYKIEKVTFIECGLYH